MKEKKNEDGENFSENDMVAFASCPAILILFGKNFHWFSLHLTYRLLLSYLFIYLICFIVCWMLVAVVFTDECRYASHRFMAISNSNIGIHSNSFGFALENANYLEQILTMCRNKNVLFECCRCHIQQLAIGYGKIAKH